MSKLFKLLDRVRKEEEGAPMIEYALLICLIALVAGVALFALGTTVSTEYSNINNCITTLNSSGC
jgi:pilus assembly protein Flp/PilA